MLKIMCFSTYEVKICSYIQILLGQAVILLYILEDPASFLPSEQLLCILPSVEQRNMVPTTRPPTTMTRTSRP